MPLTSRGDDDARPIAALGTKGAFTETLERALLDGVIDAAVHSLKDLPVEPRAGLSIGAVLEREDPSDVLVTRDGVGLADLPPGAEVGTGSPRRRAHLRAARADLVAVELRGNVDTRLARVAEGRPAAIVLAAAGLVRLGRLAPSMRRLPLESWLPAPGQGAVAVQVRAGDVAFSALDHPATRAAVEAERAALAGLGGGCLLPFGALAREEGGALVLRAVLYSAGDDGRAARVEERGAASDPDALGRRAAERLLAAAPWARRG